MWNASLGSEMRKMPGLGSVYDTILSTILGKHPLWFLSSRICKMELIWWKENDSNIFYNIVNENSS